MDFLEKTNFDNFWDKVTVRDVDQCWEWAGDMTAKGYGRVSRIIKGKRRRIHAHRIAYFLSHGVFDENLYICHSCDNRKCVNPKHLWAGSNQDNMDDMNKKGRSRQVYGDRHPRIKLSDEDVRRIRILRKNNGMYYSDIARIYSVREETIRDICNGRSRRHVT